ncbi:hypothetical protein BKA58DRAFT_388429 [Alternaria rosae]|uniref:uncharacterized protein n=1 Tax=Alternaria rosae TaxID=1187941 RepID=UPI001E8E1F45|nr:uncharacterized protein BKA58DRAFT_388429 [Alternaria rosae]KAH6866684.1 hypothetical protein BKA58DRAFT_388429 [Alternaria rosae]
MPWQTAAPTVAHHHLAPSPPTRRLAMGPSLPCRPTVAQRAPSPRPRDCVVLRPAASFVSGVPLSPWSHRSVDAKGESAREDDFPRPDYQTASCASIKPAPPATSMNRAKQNRISFSCATCCIVREIPAERLPFHKSVHYEESQTAREHPAPKALRMALKTWLDFHHYYPKWCPKASDEIFQLCRWPDWPSQSISPHPHHPRESNRMHGRQYHIQIPGNDSGFQREHGGQSMNAHCQQAVSHPERVSPHLSCKHDEGPLIMGIYLEPAT